MARAAFALTGAQADTDLVAAVTGRRLWIYNVQIITTLAGRIRVTAGADAAGTRLIDGDFGATGGIDKNYEPSGRPLPVSTALKVTSAGDVKGVIEYTVGD